MSAAHNVSQQQRLMQVILAPVISEKSTFVADKMNQVIFKVIPDATKPEIKAAVEFMFKVEVRAVQVVNVRGKEKRTQRGVSRKNHWKKAYVRLAPGQSIDLTTTD